ncbi:hypothetical protein ABTX82_01625 [Streptomyces lavendulae]|uniref:hypothetical protein n=1 Tax=Streptomyces lavendulae TaxID=1914 RepID=UPI0033174692
MPDLHGWISQQIDAIEGRAQACPPSPLLVETGTSDYAPVEVRTTAGESHAAGLLVTAATILRRCAADRKMLKIHRYAGGDSWDQYACYGCGYDDTGYIVDHTNDCETLQALAEGYGITPEELAQLDRPEWERPVTLYKSYADQMDAYCRRLDDLLRPTNPTSAVPATLRGPNWKGQP